MHQSMQQNEQNRGQPAEDGLMTIDLGRKNQSLSAVQSYIASYMYIYIMYGHSKFCTCCSQVISNFQALCMKAKSRTCSGRPSTACEGAIALGIQVTY